MMLEMNCPKCGNPITVDQHYCRECGAQLIAPRRNRVRIAGVGVLGLMFIGLLVAMFGKMFEMKWLSYLGLVVLFTAAFIMAAYALLRETRPRRRPGAVPDPGTLSIEKADTTNKLPPMSGDFVPSSVVENTTELLEVPVKRSP